MQKLVKEHNLLDKIYFLDPVFGKTKSKAYHASEIVAIPSIKDAMTTIAPEAAYCAKPVLITKTSDFHILSEMGGAVEVLPTVPALSEGLLKLVNSASLRKTMGEKGREFVTMNYSWNNITTEYLNLFESTLKN